MRPAVPLRSRLDLRVRWLIRALTALLALSAVVGGLWALIVLGLGRVPTGRQTTLLVLSALAAGLAALAYGPARERLTRRIERIFYGEGSRPDEALRVLRDPRSRAIPLDELMLQVAEALRRGLGLVAAEIWTGAEGALARTVSDPAAPVTRLALSSEAGAVVARSGLRGRGWAST